MYIDYSAWGVCVARFDISGNAKALHSGASDKHRLHVLFMCVLNPKLLTSAEGAKLNIKVRQ